MRCVVCGLVCEFAIDTNTVYHDDGTYKIQTKIADHPTYFIDLEFYPIQSDIKYEIYSFQTKDNQGRIKQKRYLPLCSAICSLEWTNLESNKNSNKKIYSK